MSDQPTKKIYNDPISVAKRTKQKIHPVAKHDKAQMLLQILGTGLQRTVIVVRTKRDAEALNTLLKSKDIKSAAVHANKRAVENDAAAKTFREGGLDILITTDMILQSLELSDIAYVISHDLPSEPKHYLSRLGCLGEIGEAIALVTPEEERDRLDIERIMRQEIREEELEGFTPSMRDEIAPTQKKNRSKKPRHRKQRKKSGKKTTKSNSTPK